MPRQSEVGTAEHTGNVLFNNVLGAKAPVARAVLTEAALGRTRGGRSIFHWFLVPGFIRVMGEMSTVV